jgi:glycosyltransferase involved in cell wall biosynthesis
MRAREETVYLFSRDERTHRLFRDSWVRAISALGKLSVLHLRFGQNLGVFGALFYFLVRSRSKRIIFGSSEILLYSVFSLRTDIWVFTGLGRLLDGRMPLVTNSLFFFLNMVYRGQRLICLNQDDLEILKAKISLNVFILPGEGYKFSANGFRGRSSNIGLVYAYIGRLLFSKGVDIILKVFSSTSHEGDLLLLYGDFDFANSDSLNYSLIEHYQSQSIGKIVMKGFKSNLNLELSNVDTVISMSRREGLPFGVLDAIDAGCNLLISNVPGHREFYDLDGVTFVENAADLMNMLLNHRIKLNRLSSSRHKERIKIAEKKFGIDQVVSILKIYII